MWETWVQALGWEHPLEKEKATQSSILAWRIPWTIQSMGLQSWTQLSKFHFPVFLPGKPHGQRSLGRYSPWGHKRVGHDQATKQQQTG